MLPKCWIFACLYIYSTASPVDNYEREQTINLLAFFSIRNFVCDTVHNFWAASMLRGFPLTPTLQHSNITTKLWEWNEKIIKSKLRSSVTVKHNEWNMVQTRHFVHTTMKICFNFDFGKEKKNRRRKRKRKKHSK